LEQEGAIVGSVHRREYISDNFAAARLDNCGRILDAEGGLRDANAEKAVRGVGAALTGMLDKLAGFDRATLVA
jgi:hypothetical protein